MDKTTSFRGNRDMRDVIDFYKEDASGPIKEKGRNNFQGPCPFCKGEDRFHCEGTRWGCRGCGASGDTVGYLKQVRGMLVPDACRLAEYRKSDTQGFTGYKGQIQKTQVQGPSDIWVQTAEELTAKASDCLSLPESIELLRLRHLTYETARAAGFGFIPQAMRMPREKWGFSSRDKNNFVFVPRGILMPVRRWGGIKSLTIRCYPTLKRGDEETRLYRIEGSCSTLNYTIGTSTEAVCIFESILDAVLAWQTSKGLLMSVATLSADLPVDDWTADIVRRCQYIFACPDRDESGKKVWQKMRTAFPDIRLANSFHSKDLGDLADAHDKDASIPSVKEWFEQKIIVPIQDTAKQQVGTVEEIADDNGTICEMVLPSHQWQSMATEVMKAAVERLYNTARAGLHYLIHRGFTDSVFKIGALGWTDGGVFTPDTWGLEGDTVQIPAGVLLATRRHNQIIGLSVLDIEDGYKSDKFFTLPGSASIVHNNDIENVPFIFGRKGQILVVCKDTFDAILIRQASKENVAVIGLNNCSSCLDLQIKRFVDSAPLTILAPDNTDAGLKMVCRWQRLFPDAEVETVPRLPIPEDDSVCITGISDLCHYHLLRPSKLSLGEWLASAIDDATVKHFQLKMIA